MHAKTFQISNFTMGVSNSILKFLSEVNYIKIPREEIGSLEGLLSVLLGIICHSWFEKDKPEIDMV